MANLFQQKLALYLGLVQTDAAGVKHLPAAAYQQLLQEPEELRARLRLAVFAYIREHNDHIDY